MSLLDSHRWLRRRVRSALRRIRLRRELGSVRLPKRDLEALFPGIGQVSLELTGEDLRRRPGTLPLSELLSLGAICRFLSPALVFEIGTFTGATTKHLALNLPDDSRILTLDLPPGSVESKIPLDQGNVTGSGFEPGIDFKGRPEANKIRQLYGDSATFDFTAYRGRVDLVFIDGNHSYEAVSIDSRNALEMVRSGGLIVWDDYHPDWGPGVMRYLEENRDLGLVSITGTRLVVHQKG